MIELDYIKFVTCCAPKQPFKIKVTLYKGKHKRHTQSTIKFLQIATGQNFNASKVKNYKKKVKTLAAFNSKNMLNIIISIYFQIKSKSMQI